jgi:hypothetical protein
VASKPDAAWLYLLGWFVLGVSAMGLYVYLATINVALLAVWPLLVVVGLSIFKCWTVRP